MKPKIFIGSSVEGLNIAYAIQQNLTHDVEATVWDQGVFELSKTTMESLNQVLVSVDFGIFVFSPDDVTIMRGRKSTSIRDNVLFELGLFIGKLGRDRVFFVIPDGKDIHIPTDLIGITPGKYNPHREDKSLQAASGAACNQVRIQIKKLGLIRPAIDREEADESSKLQNEPSDEWFGDFLIDNFELAKEKLEKIKSKKSGDELFKDEAWLAYINFKIDAKIGPQELCSFAEKYKNELVIQKLISQFLSWEDYNEKAIEIAETALRLNPSDKEFIKILSDCHKKNGELDKAIDILNKSSPESSPEIAIALSEIYEEKKSLDAAISVVHSAYLNFPSNESLTYKYARLLLEANRRKEALYLFHTLTVSHSNDQTYWGYLSNTCLMFDLYDNAMTACKKAEELSQGKEGWVIHNIGNIFNNKGLFTEAMSWLEKGLAIEPSSQYAHERLAKAIKNRDEEKEKLKEICQEGRKLIRSFQLPQEKNPHNEGIQ